MSHEYGRSPGMERETVIKDTSIEGSSPDVPVWIRLCMLRDDFWVKRLRQISHKNGFSPVE